MNTILLTFQSQAHRCRPPRTRTVASVTVVAFDDCTDIITVLLLLVIDLWSNLEFIDEVVQCLEFDAHLIFVLSDQFAQVDQCERFVQLQLFAELARHGHYLSGER